MHRPCILGPWLISGCIAPDTETTKPHLDKPHKDKDKDRDRDKFVRRILFESQPIWDSPAEEYLKCIRGLDRIPPDTFLYHPNLTTKEHR